MKYKLDTDYINKLKQKTAEQGIVFNTPKKTITTNENLPVSIFDKALEKLKGTTAKRELLKLFQEFGYAYLDRPEKNLKFYLNFTTQIQGFTDFTKKMVVWFKILNSCLHELGFVFYQEKLSYTLIIPMDNPQNIKVYKEISGSIPFLVNKKIPTQENLEKWIEMSKNFKSPQKLDKTR
ncbi:MAG: hypothetical protein MJ158_00465 [Alphaproteobacteria bacterium]|nr:hypothetical protein [Alphaproteobacteria bacterium]